MKIHTLMHARVEACHPETLLSDAVQRMKDRQIGFLPVTNTVTGALDGVLTDRDVCIAALAQKKPLHEIYVRDAMTSTVHTCNVNMNVHEAHEMMREYRIRRIPVTNDEGELVGVVSLDDLAHAAMHKLLSGARTDVAETLDAIGRSHVIL